MKKQYIEKLEAIIKQLDEVQEEMEALKGEVEQVTNGYNDYDSEYDELYRYLDECSLQHEGVRDDLTELKMTLHEDR